MMGRMFASSWRWVSRAAGPRQLEVFLILCLLISIGVFGLTPIIPGFGLSFVLPMALAGATAMWLAASRRLHPAICLLVSLLSLGIGFIFLGQILPSFLLLLFSLIKTLAQQILDHGDWTLVSQSAALLNATLTGEFDRLVLGFQTLAAGQTVRDPSVINFIWSVILWNTSAWAAWALRRWNQPLLAALPAGVILAGATNYAAATLWPLFMFVALSLALIAMTRYWLQERAWLAAGMDYASDLHSDLTMNQAGFALLLVCIAALMAFIPTPSIFQIGRRWVQENREQNRQLAQSLGLQPGNSQSLVESGAGAGLPRQHLLNTPPELSQRLVMSVQAEVITPGAGSALSLTEPVLYLRSFSYDRYDGSGWQAATSQRVTYSSGDWITGSPPGNTLPLPSQDEVIRQSILPAGRGDRSAAWLYTTGQLLSANRGYEVDWRRPPAGVEGASLLLDADMFAATIPAGRYIALSARAVPSLMELRAAGSDYPDWVLQNYLSLPEDLPARVRSLAEELALGQPTPYDVAAAIQNKLRLFPYTLDVPAPPPGVDVSDFFLFELQRGYCDYYATAMAVLARAAGLPARLVVGYIGSYNAEQRQYLIREADAHSWPEIYFPGIGWVEFEPTAAQPLPDHPKVRPGGARQEVISPAGLLTQPARVFGLEVWQAWIAGLGLLGLLLAFALWAAEVWKLRVASPASAISSIFRHLYRAGRRLKLSGKSGDTPLQFSTRLVARLDSIASSRKAPSLARRAQQDIQTLVDIYHNALYAPQPPGNLDRLRALRIWQRLRWRLWLARMLQLVTRPSP